MARSIDFYKNQSETQLNFHILLTTPEIIRKDENYLNEIFWQSIVIDAPNRAKGKLITNYGSLITITVTRLRTRGSEVQKIMDIISTNETAQQLLNKDIIDQAIRVRSTLLHATSKRAKSGADAAIPKIALKTIPTPINETQKREIRIAVTHMKDQIKEMNFKQLSSKILRILTHPYINMEREYYNTTPYLEASTKAQVITRLIQDSLSADGKILIVTEFNMVADVIEDICDEIKVSYHRLSPESTETEMFTPSVLICDQLYTKLSLDINFLPNICNSVHTVVLVDGDYQSILSTLRLGMSAASSIRKTYRLECSECDETELYAICRKADFSSIDNIKAEQICKRCILTAFQPEKTIDITQLLEADSSSIIKEDFLQEQFSKLDFWNLIIDNTEDDVEPELSNDPNREWTIRERNQVVRYSTCYGIDRNESFAKMSGIRITPEVCSKASQQILRFFAKNSRNISYLRARQLLTTDEDEAFFDTGVWADPTFRSDLKSSSNIYFKRIDFLLHMRDDLNEVSNYLQLPKWSIGVIHDSPTEVWTDTDDKALVYGSIKYGYGKYDWFVTDPDPHITSIFVSEGEEIQRFKLSKRMIKLGEAVKRKREPKQPPRPPPKNPSKSSSRKRTFDDEGVHSEWKKKDYDDVRNLLLVTGIPQTAEGHYDWEALRLNLHFSERSAEEVQKFVENYLSDCQKSIAANAKVKKESKDQDKEQTSESDESQATNSNKVPPQTADKVLKRVSSLDNLRKMLSTLSDEDLASVCSMTIDRRDLPKEFTPEMEIKFLKKFSVTGFGSGPQILQEPPFSQIFTDPANLPKSLTTDHKQINRIKTLYDTWQKSLSKGPLNSNTNQKKSIQSSTSRRKPTADDPKTKTNSTSKSATQKNEDSEKKPPKRKYLPLEKIKSGESSLPCQVAPGITLESIGHIVYDRPGFHTQRYCFPAGYSLVKSYASPTKPNERCKYRCEILDDGGNDPLFKITCLDEPNFVFQGYTPTAPWTGLARQLSTINGSKIMAPSGTAAFQMTNPVVQYLINHLPNVEKCENYTIPKDEDDSE